MLNMGAYVPEMAKQIINNQIFFISFFPTNIVCVLFTCKVLQQNDFPVADE